MKIAIDARVVGDKFGIEQYFASNLVEALLNYRDLNDEITLYVPENTYKPDVKNVKLIESDIKPGAMAEQLEFGRMLKTEKYDLVHFLGINHPRNYNLRSIFTLHSIKDKSNRINQTNLNYHHILDSSAKLITTSRAIESWCSRHLRNRTTQILVPGVDNLITTSEPISLDEPDIYSRIFCGSDALEFNLKLIPIIMEAFESIYAKNRSARLVVASTGKLGDPSLILNDRHHYLKKAVTFIENASSDKYLYEQNRSDYVLLPWGGNNTSLSALVALSHECLILAANTFSMRTLLDQCAIFYKVGDPVDIKEKLETLMYKDSVQDCLTNQLVKRSKKETWEYTVKELLSIYHDGK